MDDTCINDNRPINPAAVTHLHRPGTFGPILLAQVTNLKLPAGNPLDPPISPVLSFDIVDIEFLKSDEWKELREDWEHLRKQNSSRMKDIYPDAITLDFTPR